jgi:hypothetical protein
MATMSQTNEKAGPLRIVRRFARKMKKGGPADRPVAEAAAPVAVKAKPLPSLNDVFAGGAARAAAQATIHPLDTLKVLPTTPCMFRWGSSIVADRCPGIVAQRCK